MAKNMTLLNHYLLTEKERKLIKFLKRPNINKLTGSDEAVINFTPIEQDLLHLKQDLDKDKGYEVYAEYVAESSI